MTEPSGEQTKWRAQEHARRVELLGEFLAEEWDELTREQSVEGFIPRDMVLQLMEAAYSQGRNAIRQPIQDMLRKWALDLARDLSKADEAVQQLHQSSVELLEQAQR